MFVYVHVYTRPCVGALVQPVTDHCVMMPSYILKRTFRYQVLKAESVREQVHDMVGDERPVLQRESERETEREREREGDVDRWRQRVSARAREREKVWHLCL